MAFPMDTNVSSRSVNTTVNFTMVTAPDDDIKVHVMHRDLLSSGSFPVRYMSWINIYDSKQDDWLMLS